VLPNITFSGIMTFPWIIAVMFCITDLPGILNGPVGTLGPTAQIFYDVSGGNQAATIGLTIFLPLMDFCGTGCSVITATSRVVWSFARDGGLPEAFSRVDDRTKVPV
jgi:choline transport protein